MDAKVSSLLAVFARPISRLKRSSSESRPTRHSHAPLSHFDGSEYNFVLISPVIQPQRPVRTLRVKADENAPPTIPGPKTIHHRNKSSPAISTMLSAAGLKAPAKRTAFGDVSNTMNGVRPTKDDGAILVKPGVQVNDKPGPAVTDKKTTTFLKQASRPYSVSNLRGLLTGVSGSATTELPQKPALTETITLANSRKLMTKRPATTIFKDVGLPPIPEPVSKPVAEVKPTTTFKILTEPPLLPQIPVTAKAANVLESQPVPALDANVDGTDKPSAQPSTYSSEVEDSIALRSDGIYIDDKGNVQVYQEVESEPEEQHQTTYPEMKQTRTSLINAELYPTSNTNGLPASYPSLGARIPHAQPSQRSEPEEYWDEEEDYEEEGYVTARSFRSRGENTTGGATTVLFPQVNQKIKREIEAAKQLVEAERTPEEIEDECFDTSMVAEYGDEIFDYMRDLEVGNSGLT
jgi:hypothetical protein